MWTDLWSRVNWVVFVLAVAAVAWAWAALLSKIGDYFERNIFPPQIPKRPLPWVEIPPEISDRKEQILFPRSHRVNTSASKTTRRRNR